MKRWLTTGGCTVYQITHGRSNSYLVLDGNDSVLVDTDSRGSINTLMGKLDDLLGEKDLSWLVLTHTHYDHAENASMIKKQYNTQIAVHKDEAEHLKQGCSPIPCGTNFITRFLVGVGRKINRLSQYESANPEILVDDKYQLTTHLYLLHTPGHTEGSMSLIVDDEVALVGDAMFGVFSWSIFPPFADDVPTMINSWDKLIKTGCKTYLPGHGTENSKKLLIKQYEKHKIY
jgi:hydroxyacylglutathione hydrolase